MNIENSLNQIQISNNSNRNYFKFLIPSIFSVILISVLYLVSSNNNLKTEYSVEEKNNLINSNTFSKLRNLQFGEDDLFSRIEKQILKDTGANSFGEELLNNLKNFGDAFDILRKFISSVNYLNTRENIISNEEKNHFFDRIEKNPYNGTWEYFPYIDGVEDTSLFSIKNITKIRKYFYLNSSENEFRIGKSKKGITKLVLAKNMFEDGLLLKMKMNEGNYIDNWMEVESIIRYRDIKKEIDTKNQLYKFKGIFFTKMIKGKLFRDKKSLTKESICNSYGEFSFPLDNITYEFETHNKKRFFQNISSIDPNNFTMILSSDCGFRIKVVGKVFNITRENNFIVKKINIFLFICLISSICYSIGSICLTLSLQRNESAVQGISLSCFCQNIAWHPYCGLSNINLGMHFAKYMKNFILVSILQFINFVLFDLRFLYYYWQINRRSYMSERQYFKIRIIFFWIIYTLIFITLLSVSSFYINDNCIIALSIALWTPQLIYNIITNNRYIYPTIYIITTTFDRIIIPFYFKTYQNNFINLKLNTPLVKLLMLYILITIAFMYIQAFLGPRFMLPEKYQKSNVDFYRTKEELLKENPDFIKEECVICISPLIQPDNKIINDNSSFKNDISIVINNNKEISNKSTNESIANQNSGIELFKPNYNSNNLNDNSIHREQNISKKYHN